MKKELIDSSNISNFKVNLLERRKISTGNVNNLVKLLKLGKHFSSPFVVNEVQNDKKIIDGNHRLEAIEKCIADNPNFKIYIWIAVYKDLNEIQEREVYSSWNKGKTQSATDFLKSHFKTIPFGSQILSDLPVKIYANGKTLAVKNFVGCQICAKRHRLFEGGYSAGKEQVLIDFLQVDQADIEVLKEFYEFMKSCFGSYDKKMNSRFYTTTPLFVFYRIWFDNQHLIKSGKLEKAFKKVFGSNPTYWDQYTQSGGIMPSKTFYTIAMDNLKRNNRTLNLFNDQQAIDKYKKEMEIINLVQ